MVEKWEQWGVGDSMQCEIPGSKAKEWGESGMDSKGEILLEGGGRRWQLSHGFLFASQLSGLSPEGYRQSRLPGLSCLPTLPNPFRQVCGPVWTFLSESPLPSCPKPQARTLQDIGCGGSLAQARTEA